MLSEEKLKERLDGLERMGGFITRREATDLILLAIRETASETRKQLDFLEKRIRMLERGYGSH